jgi:glucokinase
MSIYIGCDLGGTNIKAGLVDVESGQVLMSDRVPTLSREGYEVVIKRMATLISTLMDKCGVDCGEIGGVGVSAPGELDLENGTTLFLTNFPGHWPNVPICEILQGYLNLPVVILNDVRAITLAEFIFGAGEDVEDMACFAVGTGIGGGLIINGKLLLGLRGTAGEVGHQTIDINGPRCNCGSNGCVETFASGPAIASMGIRAVSQGRETLIADMAAGDLNTITPAMIARAAKAGDVVANEIWENAGRYLGTGVANVITIFGPRRIVLSGGVMAAGDLLLDPIRRTVKERVFLVPVEEVQIVLGELGNTAGVIGMALWASRQTDR